LAITTNNFRIYLNKDCLEFGRWNSECKQIALGNSTQGSDGHRPPLQRTECPQALGFFRGVPILQGGDGRILVIGSHADEGASEQEDGDDEKFAAIADLVEINIGQEEVDEERGGKA
jgi:hypothetical protein